MQDERPPASRSAETDRLIARRYRLRQPLGKGSFGQVFLAEDIKFNPPRVVALKLLNPQFMADPKAREDVEHEASTLARFKHPNILRVIDFEVSPELAYIVTDVAEGGSLADKLRPAPGQPFVRMPLGQVAWYLQQICEALEEAHSVGLVHRDIKPMNILLDRAGRPLLADFGLAAALTSSSTSVLVDTTTSGTPLYMAPEQWQGQAGKASDIYALGVVAYQLITGQAPYQGNQAALAWQHMNAPIPRLVDRAPDLRYPPGLDTVLANAMAKDPRQRPRPASELAGQFKAALESSELPTEKGQSLLNQTVVAAPGASSSTTPIPAANGAASFAPGGPQVQATTGPTNMPPPPAPPGYMPQYTGGPTIPAGPPYSPYQPVSSGSGGFKKAGLPLAIGLVALLVIFGLVWFFALNGKPSGTGSGATGVSTTGTDSGTVVTGSTGQVDVKVIESEGGRDAKGSAVLLTVFKQGDRNKPVTTANYDNKASIKLSPGNYEIVAKYSDGIELTTAPFEVKAGQTVNQVVNFKVGRAQVQTFEAENKTAQDSYVLMTVFRQGDRNTPVTTANYVNKAEIILKPGNYEIVAKYANGVETTSSPFEIKEGQPTDLSINFKVGRVQVQAFETQGGVSAREGDTLMSVYKQGDRNQEVTNANYVNKAEIVLKPGNYEIVGKYAGRIEADSAPFEIKEGQTVSQTITFKVGRVQVQAFEADGKTARDGETLMSVYKQGDRNKEIANANYLNKADLALTPGNYEIVAKYGGRIEVVSTPFEIKEGQTASQTINFQAGRVELQVVEASGKAADDSKVLLSIYKQGDRNKEIANANYTAKADLALPPGNYEVVVKYNNKEVPGPTFEIKAGQTTSETIKV